MKNYDVKFEAVNNFVEANENLLNVMCESKEDFIKTYEVALKEDTEKVYDDLYYSMITATVVRTNLRYNEKAIKEDVQRLYTITDSLVDSFHVVAGKNPMIRTEIKQKDVIAALKKSVDAKKARAIYRAFNKAREALGTMLDAYYEERMAA